MTITDQIVKKLIDSKYDGYDYWHFVPAARTHRAKFACSTTEGCVDPVVCRGYTISPAQAIAAVGGCPPLEAMGPQFDKYVRQGIHDLFAYVEEVEAVQ